MYSVFFRLVEFNPILIGQNFKLMVVSSRVQLTVDNRVVTAVTGRGGMVIEKPR